jgi:hypothetical protein
MGEKTEFIWGLGTGFAICSFLLLMCELLK